MSRTQVRRMALRGELIELARGLYAAPAFDPSESHALAVVAARVPSAVVCLVSALAFHRLTTVQPVDVWVAVPPGGWRPKLSWPSLRVVQFAGARYEQAVEHHCIEGVDVKVYGVAKTVVDCFRFRNKIGMDVALEALRESLRSRRASPAELAHLAQTQRVGSAFHAYLQASV